MNILGAKVTHRQFGMGEIVGQDAHTVTVRFEHCDKQFLYPSAFDGFLTLAEPKQKAAVEAQLCEMRAHDDAEKHRHEEEESRRKADEQLAALKKTRADAAKKAASRKRSKGV
ncbi:MAG TPA: hypothetical protein VN446_05740 [Candidatus Acidoferrum sp.]|nr:hypothetical protein [Candidatus Acidoferrum sp.]